MKKGGSLLIPQLSCLAFALEVELQSELQITRRANHACNLAEGRRGRCPGTVGRRKTRVIGEIEKLRAEIKILVFRDVEFLPNRRVPIKEARRINRAHASAAKRSQVWQGERRST